MAGVARTREMHDVSLDRGQRQSMGSRPIVSQERMMTCRRLRALLHASPTLVGRRLGLRRPMREWGPT